MSDKLQLITPVGRLVMGSLTEMYTKDHQGNVKKTPNYFFAVAIRKDDPAFNDLWGQIYQFTHSAYQTNPQVLQRIEMGLSEMFKWKIEDGDVKHQGKEGCAGCWIFKFTTSLPFACADRNNAQIDPGTIPLGSYVDVAFNIAPNGNTDLTAGIYVNPRAIRLIGYGEEIKVGPSVQEMMGAAPQLPPGASATPVAPQAAAPAPVAPVAPQAAAPAPVAPVAPQAAAPAPVAPVAPQAAAPAPVAPVAPQAAAPATVAPAPVAPQAAAPAPVAPHTQFVNGPQAAPGVPQPTGVQMTDDEIPF